jgi:hypothetical protein
MNPASIAFCIHGSCTLDFNCISPRSCLNLNQIPKLIAFPLLLCNNPEEFYDANWTGKRKKEKRE